MVTGGQIRAARGLLRWSTTDAAAHVGITRKTVERLEQHDGIPPSRSQTLVDLQRAFEAAWHRVHWHAGGRARGSSVEKVEPLGLSRDDGPVN